jgi:hypothetical protein
MNLRAKTLLRSSVIERTRETGQVEWCDDAAGAFSVRHRASAWPAAARLIASGSFSNAVRPLNKTKLENAMISEAGMLALSRPGAAGQSAEQSQLRKANDINVDASTMGVTGI